MTISDKPVRILHVFAPNFKKRFGGPIFDWRLGFSQWCNPEIEHLVLDYDTKNILDAKEAFSFILSKKQSQISRCARLLWIFDLFSILIHNKQAYDLIHFHIMWWGTLLAAVWAKKINKKTIYQSVLMHEDTPSGIIREKLGRMKILLLRKFSAIYTINKLLSEDYLAHGFSTDQVFTLMNCVDTSVFYPVNSGAEKSILRYKYDIPDALKVIIFVGSIIPRKGVDVLIDAFIQAVSQFPSLLLLIVGPDKKDDNPSIDEEFIHHLKVKISSHGFSESTRFTGMIEERCTLSELYRLSDMFVFPSRNEGLGNVVLEAMSSGLPVVVSSLPVFREIVSNGENGIIVPLNDVNGFSAAICELAENDLLSEAMRQKAVRYIQLHHSFSEWQNKLTDFYFQLR